MARDFNRYERSDQSLGSMLGELIRDLQDLVRGEITLARQEIKEDAKRVGTRSAKGVGFMAGAAVAALVGVIFVGWTLVAALNNVLPEWLSALIVAAIFLVIGFIMYQMGMQNLKNIDLSELKPDQTIDSLKEDREWVRQQMKSDGS